ncbi:MAG: lysylphosphatidylglycerol synthase transmembrane domain-containing protein [Jannaschia sp.]
MTRPVRPALVRLAQIAVLAGLALLLWHAADGRAALALLRTADPIWLAAAGLALTLQTALSAQRWRVTAAQLGLHLPMRSALREYYLAQVVNQSLPGGVVGDAGRAVRSRGEAGLLVAAQSVVFERLAGQLGLLALLLAGLALGVLFPGSLDWPAWLWTSLATLGAGAVVVTVVASVFARVRGFCRLFAHAVLAPDVRTPQVALSLGTAGCNVVAFAFCAWALDVAMPLVAIVSLVPLILFAMVLPISIGGWGVRESAAALLFPVIGATSAEGVATGVAFGLVFLAIILPGVVLPLLRPNSPVREGITGYISPNRPKDTSRKDL